MKHLNLDIPEYSHNFDPVKNQLPISVVEWNISTAQVKTYKKMFETKQKEFRDRKKLLEPKVKKQNGVKRKGKVKKADLPKNENEDCEFVGLTIETKPKMFKINKLPKLQKIESNAVRKIGNESVRKTEKIEDCVDLTLDSDDEFVE